ncbi:MAG TPA: hypothetical protein VLB12_12865 [Gemmatimonadales bacterium]|nr:hypothetical protein [Gemmatimonadales bacterium]
MSKFTRSPMVPFPLRQRGGRPGPDRRQWVIRPDDLVVLAFDLVNLKVTPAAEHEAATLVKQGRGSAYLIVWFPPQHILEEAYFTTGLPSYPVKIPSNPGQAPLTDADQNTVKIDELGTPPIDARIAGWSRLVFQVPDDKLPLDWTLEGMLQAMRELELSVPANALPPQAKRHFLLDIIAASVKEATLTSSLGFASSASAAAAPMALGLTARVERSAGLLEAIAGPPVAGASRVFAVARSRRKVRSVGNALGLTTVTGSATKGIGAVYEDVLFGKGIAPILRRPAPAAPTVTQTALELPFRVILSPNRFGAWFHVDAPMTSEETGHTELWHSRLGVRREDGTLIDGNDPMRTLRAVWTTELPPPQTPPPDSAVQLPPHSNDFPFRASLDGFDRHSVVHLSSNFQLIDGLNPKAYYEPEPLDVDLLALSSLGAWIDSRGAWDYPQPSGLSVEEWRHRATLGRDHYVRVVYAGFLFPFGHRASLVKITERQFHGDIAGNPAYLRQRMFLIVREPLKTFRSTGLKYDGADSNRTGEQYDLMMPFEAVRILTRVSPLLDPPETDAIKGQTCFWPYVGNQPFKFHIIATDTDGNQVDMVMPLIFLGKEEADQNVPPSIVPTEVVKSYETADWPPGSKNLRATVPLHGQKLAFAGSKGPNDTSFAVQTLTFGAEVPAAATFNALTWRRLRFFPVVRKAQIDVPSLQRIARTTTPASVVFHGLYLREGFSTSNSGEVFLAADPDPAAPTLGVKFSSQGDRSGGLITPDMELSGLSRVTGPVSGNVDTVASGSFSPSAWFGAIADAKLFGVFSLTDILHDVGFDEVDKLPQFVGQSLNRVEEVISGLERLQKLASVNPGTPLSAVASVLDQLLDPTTGSIPALVGGGGAGPVASQLATLKTELGTLAGALPGSALPSGPKALIEQLRGSLEKAIDPVLADPGLLQQFADGDVLPQALHARLEWCPLIKEFGPFKPQGGNGRNLVLSVEAADAQGGGEQVFTVTCALNDFILDLEVLILTFERVQIQAVAGKKMDVDVKFTGFTFAGPLSFIETLREIIPFDGFSDPPDVQVSPSGITAGYTMGLPNLSFGVFSLENLSLGAGFSVPFVGPPVSVWFQFCTRENPSRLTVSLFGGGFFFGVTVNPDGLQIFEGAIEFGAAISVDFGVASGGVSAMAGLYFKIEGSDFTLAGYFRLRGEVEALGVVSVCIELYLEMRYESASGKCVGTATLSIEVDVTLFSVSVEISCTKKFAGAGPDPTLRELMDVQPNATSADWNTYCAAFA